MRWLETSPQIVNDSCTFYVKRPNDVGGIVVGLSSDANMVHHSDNASHKIRIAIDEAKRKTLKQSTSRSSQFSTL